MEKLSLYLLITIFICSSCGKEKELIKSQVNSTNDAIKIVDSVNGVGSHVFLSAWDASHRSMVFMYQMQTNGQLNYKILSESPPDAMQDFSNALAAKIKVGIDRAGGGDAGYASSLLQNMQSLGKRNSSVNMLRDALYRLSEMNFNAYLTPGMTDTLIGLAITQTSLVGVKEAEADIANANLEIAKVNLAIMEAKLQLADKENFSRKNDTGLKKH